MLAPEGNFLFVPGPDPTRGKFYRLGQSGPYQPNSFVVVPYVNAAAQKPEPRFYPVLEVGEHTFIPSSIAPVQKVSCLTSEERYINQVLELKAQIQRGNIYEINYCIRFESEVEAFDAFSLFARLCRTSQAPYQMLARINRDYILCCSPELFIKKQGKTLLSKPIKGTMRRGKDPQEDEQLREALYHSHKDRTENVMAVDVARNDLSKLAARGSVTVNKLYNIETYQTVHQMVSTVQCELRDGVDFAQIIEAAFPMASMTGAPKHRAMQLADKFEDFQRGYYSGTMGLIDGKGDFELPVLIRSLFYDQVQHKIWFGVGGAITYLSDPQQEYQECLLKAQGLHKALAY